MSIMSEYMITWRLLLAVVVDFVPGDKLPALHPQHPCAPPNIAVLQLDSVKILAATAALLRFTRP